MRFLSNTHDPKDPHADMYVAVGFHESPAEAVARYHAWLRGKIIGRPQATEKFTVEELERMGMVGVYQEEDAHA